MCEPQVKIFRFIVSWHNTSFEKLNQHCLIIDFFTCENENMRLVNFWIEQILFYNFFYIFLFIISIE